MIPGVFANYLQKRLEIRFKRFFYTLTSSMSSNDEYNDDKGDGYDDCDDEDNDNFDDYGH